MAGPGPELSFTIVEEMKLLGGVPDAPRRLSGPFGAPGAMCESGAGEAHEGATRSVAAAELPRPVM
eukprot:7538346-Lingulodinium_polyedra.AAC.1